jgi:hypothetical protein
VPTFDQRPTANARLAPIKEQDRARARRSDIDMPEGDKEAAVNLAVAADTMAKSPGRCIFERSRR